MENQQTPPASNQLENFFNISFDAATRAHIKQAAVWAKITSLCAFIGYGISLVVAIFGRQDYSENTESLRVGTYYRAGNIFGVLIVIVIGGIINYFLYRFAAAAAAGVDAMDNIRTNEGFNSLRIYFKICGILLIIGLSILALILLIVLLSAGLGH
jgi:hypothetical protein